MAFERSSGGVEPIRTGPAGVEEERRAATSLLATGTLACPSCDAPVVPAARVSVTEFLGCPYCGHSGRVRDFLSLASPARPARVDVRVVYRFARR